jgi:hypothetical protein
MSDAGEPLDGLRAGQAQQLASRAITALAAGDWYGAYVATSTWSTEHSGAWLTDSWLLMAACDVANGHTRGTVHPLHLGLRDYIDRPQDRAILHWARGQLLLSRLADPASALVDLELAGSDGPAWLAPYVADSVTEARREIASNGEPPEPANIDQVPSYTGNQAPPRRRPADGSTPIVFDDLVSYFTGRHLRVL